MLYAECTLALDHSLNCDLKPSMVDSCFVPNGFVENEHKELLPGVKWGNFCKLYTPAFWKYLYELHAQSDITVQNKIGSNLIEEVVACLLGGYGIPSEIGWLAFKRLQEQSLIRPNVSHNEIHLALKTPFETPQGKKILYRFYNQKSSYISRFLCRKDIEYIPLHNDLALRNWLLSIDGIGPKTASWITRNWLGSENVAILDVHIIRAGRIIGLFDDVENLSNNYFVLEKRFISFCNALGVLPSIMDSLIWSFMKRTNNLAIRALAK